MNKTSLDTPVATTVTALSDQRLLQRVKELAAIEHYVEGVVIDHLREVERRGLYLTLGFSGMFDYTMRELGYSTGAAWRRLKAMRLCEEVKGARGRLLDGTLTLDAAAQLQYAFERQERKARRAATPDTGKPDGGGRGKQSDAGSATSVMAPGARAAVAPGGSAPDVAARPAGPAGSAGAASGLVSDAPVRAPERPAAPVPDAAARESLVAQAAGKSTRQVKEMLAKVDPDLARAADRMRPLGAGRWELKAVIDDDCQVGLEQLKGLLSHVDPQMTLGQLLGRVVREALDRHDPSRPPRRQRRSRQTADVVGATSAPKDTAESDAAAVPRTARPARGATSAPKDAEAPSASAAVPRTALSEDVLTSPATVPAAPAHRRATAAVRPTAAAGTPASAPKDAAGPNAAAVPRTEVPAGAVIPAPIGIRAAGPVRLLRRRVGVRALRYPPYRHRAAESVRLPPRQVGGVGALSGPGGGRGAGMQGAPPPTERATRGLPPCYAGRADD